ncbi:glycosyltransferase family 4 protein [Sphingomonas sp. AR_OL41]|uniref:glycosyltransferase family 4 protein n=1 Tax=Sphingomonas sp. AR_OL41 TaxID=3042729 RepID=UPI00247FEE26|nr:glycosyltransferase family 4 protein [Sphingomonas sp. AR_OL41]MDH7974645.1 glycosyltransferase family 4 protein [Sphingomonas sp. AR_OL41]
MPRGRLLFVNRFYYPDHSATAQILTDLAEALAARGWKVGVIASRLRYDDPMALLPARDVHGDVAIRRVWSSRFGRAGLAGRAVDYLSFYLTAFFAILRTARRGDIIIAKTDPPLLSVVASIAARLRGAVLINWLQDLYPEVAAELGVGAMRGPLGSLLRRWRNASLRRARLNIAIGERMAERIAAEGVPAGQIALMPNWSDETAIRPLARDAVALREEWGFGDAFVVGYSGNLGRAHEFETLLGAAALLAQRDDIIFLMIGGGHESARLTARVAEEGLAARFQFRPYQPRARLSESLGAADVHWLSLRPEMEGLIVPSKFYGIAAAGRPVIAVTDLDGEIARIVRREDCGVAVAPGDAAGLAAAIAALASDAARVAAMGRAARVALERDYGRSDSFERWDRLFLSL